MTDIETRGWRERKRDETRERVWMAAIELFGKHGYEATTLDAIAEAAAISKRTFFHYFKSKEDVLAAWQAGIPEIFGAAVEAEEEGETPFEVLRNVIEKTPEQFDTVQAIRINRIIQSTPQLQASNLAKIIQMENAAVEALIKRWPQKSRRAGLRIVAMACIGTLRLAIDRFVEEEGRRPLGKHIKDALNDLASEFSDG